MSLAKRVPDLVTGIYTTGAERIISSGDTGGLRAKTLHRAARTRRWCKLQGMLGNGVSPWEKTRAGDPPGSPALCIIRRCYGRWKISVGKWNHGFFPWRARLSPETTSSTRKMMKRICAMLAAAPARPLKPRKPAINARMRKVSVQLSMVGWGLFVGMDAETLPKKTQRRHSTHDERLTLTQNPVRLLRRARWDWNAQLRVCTMQHLAVATASFRKAGEAGWSDGSPRHSGWLFPVG